MKLEVLNISKEYNGKQVVDDVSFFVQTGEIIGLLGSNGAGKTTSFYVLVGLIRAEYGQIIFDGEDITKLPMYKRALLGISYLPQESSIFRGLTVKDNLYAVLENLSISKNEQKKRYDEVIEQMHISHILDKRAYVLSGGERRRTEIARCLILKPRFLLFDEPFAGVDPITIEDMRKIICELANHGIGIILNDHNVFEVLLICNRAYLMHRGKLIAQGTPEEIKNSDIARKYYFGKQDLSANL